MELVLSFDRVVLGIKMRLVGRCLYLLSDLTVLSS